MSGEVASGRDAAGGAAALHARQEELASAGGEMAKKLKGAGAKLTINLPSVLKPFWEAEAHLDPAVQAMQKALERLGEGKLPGAGEGMRQAAVELGALSDLLALTRQRALEEIAAREEEDAGEDSGRRGMEEAQDALKKAAQELALGRPENAQTQQGAAMRGLTSAAEAMRSRLARTRFEAGRDALLAQRPDPAAGIPGLSWEVLIRGDAPEGAKKDEGKAGDAAIDASDALPEEFRELVRIYLRALAGAR